MVGDAFGGGGKGRAIHFRTTGDPETRPLDILKPVSGFPIEEGRTLLEVTEDALDLLQGTAEVFRDLSRQNVRVR